MITITGLGNLNTSNVTSMRGMFDYCFKLQTFDIDKLQTASVTDMANMFYNCKSLTSLDVSHFETGSVTDMSAMFKAIGDKVNRLTSRALIRKRRKYEQHVLFYQRIDIN